MEYSIIAAALSASFIVLSTAFGISKIASRALESIARQPEAADNIRGTMLLAIALIEGIAIICAIICLLIVFQ